MEQLTCLSSLFRPFATVHSTVEADAVIRTHHTANDENDEHVAGLLSRLGVCKFLRHDDKYLSISWSQTITKLENSLSKQTFTNDYRCQIENCSIRLPHEYFSQPLLYIIAVWVGEQDISRKLSKFSKLCNSNCLRVIAISRFENRQDDANSDIALRIVKKFSNDVHTLRLGDASSNSNVINALQASIEDELVKKINNYFDVHSKIKRATRSTFSSWFRNPTINSPSMNNESTDDLLPGDMNVLQQNRNTAKRSTFGGDDDDTPKFQSNCYEAITRNLADLLTLSGRFSEASDLYRNLSNDFKSLNLVARVHYASTLEMHSVTSILSGQPFSEFARNMELAIVAYNDASRPELAVRAALRAADACEEMKKPKIAANLLSLAAVIVRAAVTNGSGTPASFIDSATGVLHARASTALAGLGKRRKAALHAFLASGRLSKIGMMVAAATCIRHVDRKALVWPGVESEWNLVVGLAELEDGSAVDAVRCFTKVLREAKEHADVEVQSFIVRQLTAAVGKGAVDKMGRRWVDAAMFPEILVDDTCVETVDSVGIGKVVDNSHDEVLMDFEYFEKVRKALEAGEEMPERERPVNEIIAELRKMKDVNGDDDPGGSLENKIRRMKERDGVVRKRRRGRSLLKGCAVVGEPVSVTVAMRNPLHFPVFVNRLAPVVTLGDKTCTVGNEHGRVQFGDQEEIVLGPRSTQTVELSVVATSTGFLRVVGAQWLFTIGMGDRRAIASSQIPGFTEINRRGRRLNEERMHRCSEVPMYAEDTTLKLEVTDPVPRIIVTVDEFVEGEVWRNGEMRLLTLRLRNVGVVKADGVVFRTETPQSVFVAADEHGALKVGMEGLLDGDATSVAAFLPVCIEPGMEVERKFWVRASVPQNVMNAAFGKGRGRKEKGKMPECTCAITFAYGAKKARLAKWSGSILVRPSLGVSRRFLTWASGEDESAFVLGVEVEHSHSAASSGGDAPVYEVEFLGMTCKTGWKLVKLPDVERREGAVVMRNKEGTLRVNETATLFAKVGKYGKENVWDTSIVEMKSDVEEQFRDATRHFSVACQVKGRKWNACALVAVAWKNSELCRGVLFLSAIDLTRYVAAAVAGGGSRPGSGLGTRSNSYTSLSGVSGIGQPGDVERQLVVIKEMPPIEVTLKHTNRMVHDFSKGPAVVPVDVYVKNATGRLVDVSVAAAPHEQIADGSRGRYWTGDVSMSLRALPPGACRFIMLTAVLERAGSFDMAKISVKWAVCGGGKKSAVDVDSSFVEVVEDSKASSSGALSELSEVVRGSVDLEEEVVRRARLGLKR